MKNIHRIAMLFVAVIVIGAMLRASEITSGKFGSIGWACQMSRCFAYSTATGEILLIKGAEQIEMGVHP